jgi:lipopolysaccharide/colanic/teichoic acid biosynthesis glycosyltransferase
MTVRDVRLAGSPVRPAARLAEELRGSVDFLLALIVVVILSPVFVVVALVVRLTSPGPVLFRQERLGRDRRPFSIYKFRTMQVDNDDAEHRKYVTALLTEDVAPHGGADGVYKLVGDPRVTPVGRFLRRTSLDELPQLFNVLRGEMALVGPRPTLAWEAELFPPETELRFTVRPGITGLWQVGGRGGVDMRTALQMDCEYVRTRSVAGDVRILLRTIVVLFGRSVTS